MKVSASWATGKSIQHTSAAVVARVERDPQADDKWKMWKFFPPPNPSSRDEFVRLEMLFAMLCESFSQLAGSMLTSVYSTCWHGHLGSCDHWATGESVEFLEQVDCALLLLVFHSEMLFAMLCESFSQLGYSTLVIVHEKFCELYDFLHVHVL